MDPIKQAIAHCFHGFEKLRNTLSGDDTALVDNEASRLRLWVKDAETHLGISVIDYNLRDNRQLRNRVVEILHRVNVALLQSNLDSYIASVRPRPKDDDDDIEQIHVRRSSHASSAEVLEEIAEHHLLSPLEIREQLVDGDPATEQDPDDVDSQDNLDWTTQLKRAGRLISILFRLQSSLQYPARHDQILSGQIAGAEAYEIQDVERVRKEFPTIPDFLAERLGKAITERRQYFQFKADQVVGDDSSSSSSDSGRLDVNETLSDNSAVSIDEVIERSDSIEPLEIEPGSFVTMSYPGQDLSDGTPSKCSICHDTFSPTKLDFWSEHRDQDLTSYLCTCGDCPIGSRQYSTREEWKLHEISMHHRVWTCPFSCKDVLESENTFEQHLITVHDQADEPRNLQVLAQACSRPDELSQELLCPLCQGSSASLDARYTHVGDHLRRLSYFSLPRHLVIVKPAAENVLLDFLHEISADDSSEYASEYEDSHSNSSGVDENSTKTSKSLFSKVKEGQRVKTRLGDNTSDVGPRPKDRASDDVKSRELEAIRVLPGPWRPKPSGKRDSPENKAASVVNDLPQNPQASSPLITSQPNVLQLTKNAIPWRPGTDVRAELTTLSKAKEASITSLGSTKEDIRLQDDNLNSMKFPFEAVKTWNGFEKLVKELYRGKGTYESEITAGRYDVFDHDNFKVLPSLWEHSVKPGRQFYIAFWKKHKGSKSHRNQGWESGINYFSDRSYGADPWVGRPLSPIPAPQPQQYPGIRDYEGWYPNLESATGGGFKRPGKWPAGNHENGGERVPIISIPSKFSEEERKVYEQGYVAGYLRENRSTRDIEDQAIVQHERKQRREKDERAWMYQEFLREQKEREEKKKVDDDRFEEKLQKEMHNRLENLGYAKPTIEIMIDKQKADEFKDKILEEQGKGPAYYRIHKDHLAMETLTYYDLPWEYDKDDPNYFIILKDLDDTEKDVILEHTRRVRSRRLLTIDQKRETASPAWHKKPSRNSSVKKSEKEGESVVIKRQPEHTVTLPERRRAKEVEVESVH